MRFVLAVIPMLLPAACGEPLPRGFDALDSNERHAAIVAAAADPSAGSSRGLVRMLDSDDPATRMLAIRALERRHGQTLGYEHAAPRAERDPAAARWAEWVRTHEAAGDAGP